MNENRIAENAQRLIELGFENEEAWKISRLMDKSEIERTEDDNKIIDEAFIKMNQDTRLLIQGYPLASKIQSQFLMNDLFNDLESSLKDGMQDKYQKAGFPNGESEEGFLEWLAELEKQQQILDQLKQIFNIE